MVETLLHASPLVLALIGALWKLPEWVHKWVAVAREVRDFRSGR
jgi:hypothetical protein